jgi:thymidine phosphorylase
VALGGGRRRPGEAIDPRVGFSDLAEVGTDVTARPLGVVHAADETAADAAAAVLRSAYRIADTGAVPRDPVLEAVGAG